MPVIHTRGPGPARAIIEPVVWPARRVGSHDAWAQGMCMRRPSAGCSSPWLRSAAASTANGSPGREASAWVQARRRWPPVATAMSGSPNARAKSRSPRSRHSPCARAYAAASGCTRSWSRPIDSTLDDATTPRTRRAAHSHPAVSSSHAPSPSASKKLLW